MTLLMPQATSSWLMLMFFGGAVAIATSGFLLLRSASRQEVTGDEEADLRAGQRPAGGREQSEVGRSLSQAGFSSPYAVQVFYALKVMAGFAFAAPLGWVLRRGDLMPDSGPLVGLALVVAAGGLGFWLPTMVVGKLQAAWKHRIEVAIPDALDFMLVCVEAGQSLDLAAQRVAVELENVHPDLAKRFLVLTKALAAGADRQDAFAQLAVSTGSDDLRQFATLVVQSATMGTPVAHSLRVFAADLRDRRIRRIEAKAAILPTKMSLGTMMFTVPPLLVLLLSPAVWRIVNLM